MLQNWGLVSWSLCHIWWWKSIFQISNNHHSIHICNLLNLGDIQTSDPKIDLLSHLFCQTRRNYGNYYTEILKQSKQMVCKKLLHWDFSNSSKNREYSQQKSSKRRRTKIHQLFYPKKLPSSHNKNRNFNRKKMLNNHFVPSTTEIPKKNNIPKNNQKAREKKKKKALTNQTAGGRERAFERERERGTQIKPLDPTHRRIWDGERERDPNQTVRPNPPPHLRGRESVTSRLMDKSIN